VRSKCSWPSRLR